MGGVTAGEVARTATPDFRKAAARLAPLLDRAAEDIERARGLPQDLFDALHEAGLFAICSPRELGGYDVDTETCFEVIEAVSRAQGSAGWTMFAHAFAAGLAGAYLEDAAARRIFAGPKAPILAGQGPPGGRAERDGESYLVNGRWSYGSGCARADWILGGCLVTAGGKPEMRDPTTPAVVTVYTERKNVAIEDNWNVLGLAGTGSFDYAMRDVAVAADFAHDGPAPALRRGRLFRYGLVGVANLCHTAFVIGAGRRALDEVVRLAPAKSGPFGRVADNESFQDGLGRAEAAWHAARAFAFDVHARAQRIIESGDEVGQDHYTKVRMATMHAHQAMSEAAGFAYRSGGGAALRTGALNRAFRDVHTATQHVLVSMHTARDCGRALLGVLPGARWTQAGYR